MDRAGERGGALHKRRFGALELLFLRFAAGGAVPAGWFLADLPSAAERAARTGRLSLEVVSHCWGYAHLLVYQLSSLVQHPPQSLDVTMTVFYCVEDEETVELLDHFGALEIPGVAWNWKALPRQELFRRAIGRNIAALETEADWIWFTDCDLMFQEGCLDALAERLQGRTEALLFPREERCTSLLQSSDPLLQVGKDGPRVVQLETDKFTVRERTRATGPLQITHGDVARAAGYCRDLGLYQQPSETWCKAYEDRAFRWLLRTQGTPIELPGVYRLRHAEKGRYTGSTSGLAWLRGVIRRLTSWFDERGLRGERAE